MVNFRNVKAYESLVFHPWLDSRIIFMSVFHRIISIKIQILSWREDRDNIIQSSLLLCEG